jgi:hypothetical protein
MCTAAAAAIAASVPAQAQNFNRDRNVSVRERPHPEFDQLGAPVGPFRGYAQLPVGVTFTDNVFATGTNAESDMIYVIAPSVRLQSEFNEHELNVFADIDYLGYTDFEDESRTNASIGADARLDVRRDLTANFNVSNGWFEEARTNPNTPGGSAEPVEYNQSSFGAGLSHELSRVRLSGSASLTSFDFDDAVDGIGAPIEQDDRDHDAFGYRFRADYAYSPSVSFFASAEYTDRDYDILSTGPGGPVSRESHGTSLFVGADFDVTRLARGVVAVGTLNEQFADPNTADEDGLAASATVEWFPTELATIEFTASRSISPAGVPGASGAVTTAYGARADYEVLRNLIVSGVLSRREDEFTGAVDRTDEDMTLGVEATYLVNRNVGLSFNVSRLDRSSSGVNSGTEFDENRIGASLVLRY